MASPDMDDLAAKVAKLKLPATNLDGQNATSLLPTAETTEQRSTDNNQDSIASSRPSRRQRHGRKQQVISNSLTSQQPTTEETSPRKSASQRLSKQQQPTITQYYETRTRSSTKTITGNQATSSRNHKSMTPCTRNTTPNISTCPMATCISTLR